MLITIENPKYFKLIHKQSGMKFNTWNTDFISYDDERFDIEKEKEQKTLL